MRRALTLKKREAELVHVSTGCKDIDRIFNHKGLFPRGLYEVYGSAGTGKTQFLLQCLTVNYPAVYICTEGKACSKRLREILLCSLNYDSEKTSAVLDKILITEVSTVNDFWDIIDVKLPFLCKKMQIKLVVIDSIAALFRSGVEFNKNKADIVDRSVWLFHVAARLKELSHKNNFPIIIANQVSESLSKGATVPALGLSWSHCIDTRLCLSRAPEAKYRKFRIIFSPLYAEQEVLFQVTKEGIKSI